MSKLAESQMELAVAVNPTNPAQQFASSNTDPIATGLFAAFTQDGGVTWNKVDPDDGIIAEGSDFPLACCDPYASWDSFGNLFLTYFNSQVPNPSAPLLVSINGGQDFSVHASLGPGGDRPTIATGPGGVWVLYRGSGGALTAQGASTTGLGAVGSFSPPQTVAAGVLPVPTEIAIAPDGKVLVVYQQAAAVNSPATIFTAVDGDGLGGGGFGTPTVATATNMRHLTEFIPAQPDRGVTASAGLAYDLSGGPNHGRVYLVYADEFPDGSDDTDIFLRFSTNNGTSWSARVRVNDDGTRSQFLPRIAVDPTSGHVAVSWHDARNDAGGGPPHDHDGMANTDAEMFAALSVDGGATFLPNVQVSAGASNQNELLSSIDYGDYTGLAFARGLIAPAWADNSNSTGGNPGVPPPTIPPTDLVPGTTNDAYTAACGLDSDGDSVMDAKDNCLLLANAPPNDCDTDQDGYGNYCDGDFDQGNTVNVIDFTTRFLPDFKAGSDKAPIDGTDMNCSGGVNTTDFSNHFLPSFKAGKPGPSGLFCAGTVPCDL